MQTGNAARDESADNISQPASPNPPISILHSAPAKPVAASLPPPAQPEATPASPPLYGGGRGAELEISPASEKITINLEREKITSVVSRTSKMKGDLETEEGFRIDGEVRGDVTAKTMVVVTEGGAVYGKVSAERVVVLGKVDGGVEATHSLLVAKTGVLNGAIRYRSIITYQGSTIEGTMNRITD